ncbi:DUF3836 domain-containing protein [Prevotella sp. 10(H)]|uniref:DUF3836 domain-containing protein n=1 Tax=Prevotella sp. 10(H) TaxID=1158294 RepID=UPI0009DEBC15|nr:DUF3836 domain-containing protein [Prevotella sp. 10(H)]
MKTTILTSVFAVLVSIMNVSAQNVNVLSNISNDETGTKKEYITVDKAYAPLTKVYYFYDVNGNLKERTTSVWNNEKGWENRITYSYEYEIDNTLAYVAFKKWDNNTNNWSNNPEVIMNERIDNEYLAVKPFQINYDEEDTILFVQK